MCAILRIQRVGIKITYVLYFSKINVPDVWFYFAEALRLLSTYIPDIYILLSKRAITKELLFTYLHSRQPEANTDFTKSPTAPPPCW